MYEQNKYFNITQFGSIKAFHQLMREKRRGVVKTRKLAQTRNAHKQKKLHNQASKQFIF